MQFFLLTVYLISLYIVGGIVFRLFPLSVSKLIGHVFKIFTGIIVGAPITYFLSCLFVLTGKPILFGAFGMIGVSLLSFIIFVVHDMRAKKKEKREMQQHINYGDMALIVVVLLFSCWIMWKSVRTGADNTWLVSRNTVFDTAHALSLVRSFSLGDNIPYTSPFAAGAVELYHFIFYFFVGLVEQFDIPLIVAFNAVSAFGFSVYCIVGFYIAYMVAEKNRIVGWMTIVFLITHSTLTWWYFLLQQGIHASIFTSLWRLPNYLFAGPYDGSVISLFFTLNVFVNQRHLSFAIAAGFLLCFMADALFKQKKSSYWKYGVLGGMIGLLFWWNLVITVTVMGVVLLLGIFFKKYRETLFCLFVFGSIVCIGCIPFFPVLKEFFASNTSQSVIGSKISFLSVLAKQIRYWAVNLGLGIIAYIVGYMHVQKQYKKMFVSIGMLFFIFAIGFAFGKNEIAQKMLSFWNVVFVSMCAYGVWSFWKKGKIFRFLSVLLFFGMTASGLIDLMVIKNDFAYPAVSLEMNHRTRMLEHTIPKNAVVLSYSEMFHDVALAGKKQYYGFFAPPGVSTRLGREKDIFEATTAAILEENMKNVSVTYVYLPKNSSPDFPYVTNLDFYRELYPVRYEDNTFILFEVVSHMIQ